DSRPYPESPSKLTSGLPVTDPFSSTASPCRPASFDIATDTPSSASAQPATPGLSFHFHTGVLSGLPLSTRWIVSASGARSVTQTSEPSDEAQMPPGVCSPLDTTREPAFGLPSAALPLVSMRSTLPAS